MRSLITALISPLGTWLLLMVAGLGLAALRRASLGRAAILVGTLWLLLWSLPFPSTWLRDRLEAPYPPLPLAAVPTAQAIVVLGGAISPPAIGRPYPDLSATADRVWHGARLYRAGKAPLMLLSGGSNLQIATMSEAQAMQIFLGDLGVPASALLLEGDSRTTQENAIFSFRLLQARGIRRILLVTSAMHMARAASHFRAAGFEVVPVAIDQGGPLDWSALSTWLPDAGSLETSGRAFKELAGRAVARWVR